MTIETKTAGATDASTLKLAMLPITPGGTPNIVDDAFEAALASAREGGDALQNYFDAMNETSHFWDFVAQNDANAQNVYADATDPQGNPITIVNSGNTAMRFGVFYRGDTAAARVDNPDETSVTGLATIQLANTTTRISKFCSFGAVIVDIAPGILLTRALFADLIKPIYRNMAKWFSDNADRIRTALNIEGEPEVYPDANIRRVFEDHDDDLEGLGGELAEQGATDLTINWSAGVFEVAGLGALAALPLVVSLLGKRMVASVLIINKTDIDFTWDLAYADKGKVSVQPESTDGNKIPKMSVVTDMWGDTTSAKAAFEANFQFINANDFDGIGYLIRLTPGSGSGAASIGNLLIKIPWFGKSAIWVGDSGESAQATYEAHDSATGLLSMTHQYDAYKITLACTSAKVREKDGQYFYAFMAIIEQSS